MLKPTFLAKSMLSKHLSTPFLLQSFSTTHNPSYLQTPTKLAAQLSFSKNPVELEALAKALDRRANNNKSWPRWLWGRGVTWGVRGIVAFLAVGGIGAGIGAVEEKEELRGEIERLKR